MIDSKKWIKIFIITFFLPIISLIPVTNVRAQSYSDISVQIAYEMINNNTLYPNLVILDVREQWEYDENHLCNAHLIPLAQIDARISELESYKDTEIIVYCASGSRSAQASQNLADNHNFTKIYNMMGGINAWLTEGYDVCTGQSLPTIPFSIYSILIITIGMIVVVLIYVKHQK
ncbi:MAG: rhodanese-like domain-containing protein [Promethearchaeota archaeon]|nr:MAG: rhodanese-like domain-containing protein [Candidatus Lokiarchaeota archaeon]